MDFFFCFEFLSKKHCSNLNSSEFYFFVVVILWIEQRTLHMLGKLSTTELIFLAPEFLIYVNLILYGWVASWASAQYMP
jgi:hypothetical protein